jgi:hypothetical protein
MRKITHDFHENPPNHGQRYYCLSALVLALIGLAYAAWRIYVS